MKDWLSFFCVTPLESLLFVVSLVAPTASMTLTGFQLNHDGPLLLISLGTGFKLWMEWLRHRQWLKYKDSGFVPGSQHLSVLGSLGVCGGIWGAGLWLWLRN